MRDLWAGLPADAQDLLVLLAQLAPTFLVGGLLARGFAPWPLVRAILARFAAVHAIFVALIALALGMGLALMAQERGLRQGSAAAAAPFDLVVAAPGSEVTMLLAAVYLRPSDVGLVGGDAFARIAADPRVALAAPISFGDSVGGSPVVGTIAAFVDRLSGAPQVGRVFADHEEAVVGAGTGLRLGDRIVPAHGTGPAADDHAHGGFAYEVVGVMAPTGTPWDGAILVPVESVWEVHGLANGHDPAAGETLGPPFDPAYFPGTPAVLVTPQSLGQAWALQSEFTRSGETMAFLPGAVLSQLHALLGDVRQAMSMMSLVAELIVLASVLMGLSLLLRLIRREIRLLRILGAPTRFVAATIWSYVSTLLVSGIVLSLPAALIATSVLAQLVSRHTGMSVPSELGWAELHHLALILTVGSGLALLPTLTAGRMDVVTS